MFNFLKKNRKEEIRNEFNELFVEYTDIFEKANHEINKNNNGLSMFPNGGFHQSSLAKSFFGSFFGSSNNLRF